ncbi:MAG: Hpt domain-containing protein [Desulfonauticus sp.]|nr:Hpt domain-containing protein [Desulfonauticus sp.]
MDVNEIRNYMAKVYELETELVEKLFKAGVASTEELITSIENCVQTGKVSDILSKFHTLKNNFASMGLEELREYAAQAEKALKNKEQIDFKELIRKIKANWDQIINRFD